MKKELRVMALDDIRPYENNPRHNDQAVDAVAESIRQCEYIAPIVVDEDFVILAGHTRAKALEKLGREEAEVMIVSGLTNEQKKKYRLLDNKTNELAEWDFDKLTKELEGLDFDDYDFGFDIDLNFNAETLDEIIEDEAPALPEEPKAKVGDIYQLGSHRVMCGDATDAATVAILMNGEKADVVFTDPPYNIASDSKNFAATGKTTKKTYKTLAESDWDKDFDIKPALTNISDFSKADSVAYICTSHFLIQTIWDWAKEFYKFNNYIVWCKPNPTPSLSKRHWTFATELIVYATRGKHTCNFPKRQNFLNFFGYEESDVKEIEFCPEMNYWVFNKEAHSTGHPTQKPVKVCARPIFFSSKKGDIIMDLFGGSGSTLIACEQTGRKCYMMELDPHYVDVIIERWENFTGEKAIKLN